MPDPTMLYKHPGPHEIHGGHFDYIIVDADEEGALEAAIDNGWRLTTGAALELSEHGDIDAPPTREELKQKAEELGIEFAKNISDRRLAEMIQAAIQANQELQ